MDLVIIILMDCWNREEGASLSWELPVLKNFCIIWKKKTGWTLRFGIIFSEDFVLLFFMMCFEWQQKLIRWFPVLPPYPFLFLSAEWQENLKPRNPKFRSWLYSCFSTHPFSRSLNHSSLLLSHVGGKKFPFFWKAEMIFSHLSSSLSDCVSLSYD